MELTQERVRQLFDYVDGQLIAKERAKGRKPGKPVGCESKGYLIAMVAGRLYKVHRLIYLWHHGILPLIVDHIDCNRGNNRIENLRAADHYGNSRNARLSKNNTSGYKGVSLDKRRNKWMAQLSLDRRHIHLGYFDNPELAAEAYRVAIERIHGDFARVA